ncbi:hypothetical protein [Pseudonocardia parietis]|uniref:PD-(D/E)XK nuclease superfamily protein n=1 Tax=Pseudonocardia parietis TaxID=570936 RepID=A0ABS4W5Q8_9PSEU|nr:hypothetical protein [Pseudonocardia parietis]MBP2371540.1 hypothetical protein [Pseudonocardia parietis]
MATRFYGEVGGAFGQRLGFAVEPAPPYYALLGAYNAGLIGWDDANALAARFPTHRDVPPPAPDRRDDRLSDRPAPAGWLDLRPPPGPEPAPARWQRGTATAAVQAIAARTADLLARDTEPGRFGSVEVETELNRLCLLLAGWEQAYRGGALDREVAAFYRTLADARLTSGADRELLVAAVEGLERAPCTDLDALTAAARDTGLLDQLRTLAGDPTPGQSLGHAGPVFVPEWADGDVLIIHPDRATGATLLDVKTVTRVDDSRRVAGWLFQVLAYAFLDAESGDDWGIGRVGLVFARHGVVRWWPRDELTTYLAGGRCPAEVRREFFTEFEQTITRLGARITT